MKSLKSINKENLSMHIISLIIFANIIQNGLLFAFNISINIFVQYILLLILFWINNWNFENKKVLMIIYISIVIFLIDNILFQQKNNITYFKQFFLYGFPVISCFLIKIDFKKLNTVFLKYAIACTILYILSIVTNVNLIKLNYMTWGFAFAFCISYIYIYFSLNNRKNFILNLCFIPLIILNISYGSKSSLIIIFLTISSCYYYNNNNSLIKKIVILIVLFIVMSFWKEIVYFIIFNLKEYFKLDTYSINSFLLYLKEDFNSGFLGSRQDIYFNTLETIKLNPFGIGIGGFEQLFGTYPHNFIIDVIVTFGVINGGIMILLMILYTFRTLNLGINKAESIFLIFVITNFSKLFFSKTFTNDINFWLYISVIGSLLSIYKYKATKKFKSVNKKVCFKQNI